ncbi:phage tail tape measure protein [Faecalimicrobium sp. JNUCC 81]
MSLNVGTAVGYLDLDTKKFESGIKGAMKQLEVFSNNTSTSGQKMEALGGVMKNVGAGMTKFVTAPLVGVGALSIKTAADFESGMSKVQAISGATGEDMKKLENMAKDLGASTKFSARDAADALSYMGMAGWKTEDMMSGLPGVLDLAAAGGTDLALTSDIVTDGLTGLGLTAKDTGMFVDVMAATCSNSNTSIELMGETLKYVGPVAGALGINMQDLSLAIGLMGNAGIKGSSAGTALRGGLTNLVKPTKQMQKVMDKYNIEIQKNADGSVDLMGTMNHLRDKLGGLNETTQANALATIFGKEAMSGWAAIINASEGDFEKLSGAISNSEGTAKTMAETMQDNLKGAIDNLKSAFEGACIVIGERLIPMFQGIVEWATNCLTWFNNLDSGTQDLIVAVGVLVAAIGPLIFIAGTLLTVLPNMVAGFKLAKTAVVAFQGATLAVPIAIGAVIAALVGLASWVGSSSTAIAFLQDKFGLLGYVIGGTCEIINGIVQLTFGNMIIIIQTAAKAIQAIFKGQFWKLDDIAREGWAKVENNTAEAMSDIAGETTEGVRLIKTRTESELKNVTDVFDKAMKELPSLTKDNAGEIAKSFTDGLDKLDQESLTILRGTSDSMAVLFEGIKEGMNPEAATKKFTANLESMAVSGKYDMETLQGDIDKAMKTITANMLIESEAFKQNATNVFNEFKTVGSQGVEGMASNVANIIYQMDAETVSQLSNMGGTWNQILSGIASDGSMNTTQMKEAIIANLNSMGIDGAQLISQLRTESSQHMKAMVDDADKNSKELEKAVDDGTKGAKDKGTKNVKEYAKNVKDGTKDGTDGAKKNTQDLAKNTEDDLKKAGDSAKKNMNQGAKGVKEATSKMSSETKKDTAKVAKDIDEDFKKGTKSVKQEATNMYNGAKTSFTKLAQIAKQAGSDAYNGIRISFGKIPGIVENSITSAADSAKSAASSFKSAGQAAGQAWIDGFNSKKSAMASAAANVPKPSASRSFSPEPTLAPSRTRRSVSFIALPSSSSMANSLSRSVASLSAQPSLQSATLSDRMASSTLKDSLKSTIKDFEESMKIKGKESKESRNINFYNTYNSPKPSSIRDLKRQDEIQMRRLALKFR